jgi:RNA polymerase primary sigma factor
MPAGNIRAGATILMMYKEHVGGICAGGMNAMRGSKGVVVVEYRTRGTDTYMREIGHYQPLSSEEEARLAKRIRKGDRQALHKLIKSNLRFVVSVARNYQHQGVPLPDLIGEGNRGLMRAAIKFDDKKNFRFISYAVWWVRQAILQALAAQSRMVKVPLNQAGRVYQVARLEQKLVQKLHREPDHDEMVNEGSVSRVQLEVAQQIARKGVSLDSPVGDSGDRTIGSVLPADNSWEPDTRIDEDSFRGAIGRQLQTLSPRERRVLELHFGLHSGVGLTLEEVGKHLGITREGVRLIRDRALEKLKVQCGDRLREIERN